MIYNNGLGTSTITAEAGFKPALVLDPPSLKSKQNPRQVKDLAWGYFH